MHILVFTLLFLIGGVASAAAQLRGRVLDEQTGSGIADASVRVLAAAREYAVFTDRSGAYVFRQLPSAEYWLMVRHPGYEDVTLRVRLPAGSEVVIDVPLELQPIPITPVHVPVSRTVMVRAAPGSADSLLAELTNQPSGVLRAAAPGALGDLVQVDSRDPPSEPPSDGGAHTLHVWGSSAERGRVLVGDASVNAPLHLGAILPPVEPQLLARAELRTGGAPARYDGGTNYIVEYLLQQRPERLLAWGELGLLTSRIGVQAPLGDGGSAAAAVRRVNDEAVDAVIDGAFDYEYSDALTHASWRTGTSTGMDATLLLTRETVRIPRDQADDAAAWRNVAASVSWGADRQASGPRIGLAYSRGIVDLPLLSAPDGHLNARFERSAFTASRGWRGGTTSFDAGLELEHLRFARTATASADPLNPGVPGPVRCTVILPCASMTATRAAAFGDVAWQPAPRLSVHAGLRANLEAESGRTHLLPRLALSWLGDGSTTATVSAGRYSQLGVLDYPTGVPVHPISGLLAQTHLATQYELNIAHRTSGFALEAAAFVRRQQRQSAAVESLPGASLSWAFVVDRSSVSGGYSLLARASRPDSAPTYQHRAYMSAGTGRGPLQLDVAAVYGAGVPLTSIVLDQPAPFEGPPPPATGRGLEDGPYMRLDAVLSADWMVEWRGRDVRVMPYAKLINAFTRRGALFYYRAGSASELQPLSALPTMPILGVRWTF